MNAALDDANGELVRLRGCLNDLVSIMALPALWAGGDARRVAGSLADALLEMLHLSFVIVRVMDIEGAAVDVTKSADLTEDVAGAHALGDAVAATLGQGPDAWPSHARTIVADVPVSVASARLGIHGELGVVVAGTPRATFPDQAERLLLDVAANQAAIALQQTRLLDEQKRVSTELDRRVAQRTRELATANEVLKQREHESRLILDSIPGLTAALGPDGRLEVVNRQIVEYSGRPLADLQNWETNGIVFEEDVPRVREVFSRAIDAGLPYEFELRLRRFDGPYRWFSNRGIPVRDAAGRTVRWYVLLTDIDERKRVEEALRESEYESRLIVDTMPGLVSVLTETGALERVNRPLVEYFGTSLEELSRWRTNEAVHPDDRDRTAQAIAQAILSGEPPDFEARIRRFDGVYRWFQIRGLPLRDRNGRIVRWYLLNTDIHDRTRAEVELKRSEMLLAEGLRLSATGTFSWPVDTDELTFSEELQRIFGFEERAIGVERIAARVHPEDLALFRRRMAEVRAGHDNDEYEIRLQMPDHQIKYLRVFGRLVRQPNGRLECVGAVQDVTRRRRAEDALDHARSELTHVARITSLSTLAASIAHEVNQPLSGIVTNAGTCLRMLDADPPNIEGARETARRTIRDGHRASDVITRLRALFSKKDFTLEPLDLNEALREVLALSAGDLQRRRVTLQSECAEDLPLVTGDRVQLQQVILNLLRNAADATGAVDDRPREVVVKTERLDHNAVRVSVRDAGVGVDPDNLDKLYDAFYTTKSGGMGMGLFVSRSIVERHHGRLWAEPNDGPGATFAFEIPCAAQDRAD